MFLWLAHFSNWLSGLNVFQYTTFRAVMAALTALAFSLLLGPWTIRKLTQLKVGQAVRTDGPQTHLIKNGTPTMGGSLILTAITVSTILWGNWANPYIWILLGVLLATGALGFYDDWRKVVYKDPNGVSPKFKMVWQSSVAIIAALALFYLASNSSNNILIVPFFKQVALPLGVVGFVVLTYLTIVGTSNAVNLTDGLDGLAAFPVVLVAAGLAIFAYASGHSQFAQAPGSHPMIIEIRHRAEGNVHRNAPHVSRTSQPGRLGTASSEVMLQYRAAKPQNVQSEPPEGVEPSTTRLQGERSGR